MTMSNHENAYFEQIISKSVAYLEYGSGASTILAAESVSTLKIISVESDVMFLTRNLMPSYAIRNALQCGKLEFVSPDIGNTGEWGIPLDMSSEHMWPHYALCPYTKREFNPDLILVDGRFRVACCLVAAIQVPQATILLHDYTNRKEYHVLSDFFDIIDIVDTLVKLKVSTNFNHYKAQQCIKAYLFKPTDIHQSRIQIIKARTKQIMTQIQTYYRIKCLLCG